MSTPLIARALALALFCTSFGARSAHAQDRDPAAAEALFAQGRELMNAQRYPEACSKLAESQRLDPGIGTQFHLAVCFEHEGKLASAWAAFREVASLATASGQQDRATAANRRASLLESRLPRLTIVVPSDARTTGLEITRDGIIVGEAQWDAALPVDPGDHQLEITAPGKRAFAAVVKAAEGSPASFQVRPLEPAVVGEAEPAKEPTLVAESAPPSAPPAPAPARDAPSAASSSSGPGGLVLALGVAGVVGIGAGAVFGLMARSKNKDSKEHCPMVDTQCDAEGVALRDDAFTLSDLATAGFIAGGALVATAGILWLLRGGTEAKPGEVAVAVAAAPGAADVMVRGSF